MLVSARPSVCPSIVVVTLTWLFFLSDFFQISYMDCFHQTLVGFCPTNNNKLDYFYQTLAQVRSGALSANQDGLKNGPNQSVCTCGHSNLIIYRPIPSKVHIWTTFIKLLFMSEYVFCPMNDNEVSPKRISLFTAGHYAGPFVWAWLF